MAPAKRDQKEISSHKIVERRRRHRINTCIAQLSQAIPAAFSKSVNRRRGLSGKLEKAEVLEMAVSYVKHIQSNMKGQENRDSNSGDPGDPKRDEVDMRHFEEGYRECVKEVARYLAEVEGMNPQDVRFLRLLCHLQTRGPAARGLSNGKFGSVINFGLREPGVRENHVTHGANTSAQSVPLPSNVTVTSRFNRALLTNGNRKCSSPVKVTSTEDKMEEKMEESSEKATEDAENADRRSASSEIDVVNGEATVPDLSPTTSVTTSSSSSDVTQTSPPTLSVTVASAGESSPTSDVISSHTSPSLSPVISGEAPVTSSTTVTSHPVATKSRLVSILSTPCVTSATSALMSNPLTSLANMHTSLVSASTSGFRSSTPSTTLACTGPPAGPLVTFLPQLPVPGMQGKLLPAAPRLVVDPMTGQQFFVPQYIQVPAHVQVSPTAANHVIVSPSHVASSANQNPLSQVIPSANHGPLGHMISTANQTGMNTMMQCPALVTLAPHGGLLSSTVMADTSDAMKQFPVPGHYLHGIPVANFDLPLATHAQTPPAPINPIRALENIARKHPR